jgi:YbbR domain-containing protein
MKLGGNLFENLGIKVVALIFALALYAHVATEQQSERVLYFPLHIDGLADSLALATPPPEQIGAHVRGTVKQLIRLSIIRPPVTLHLDGVASGKYQRALTTADYKVVGQEGVEILAPAEPAAIDLTIEPRAQARVPVAVRWKGEPVRGFVLVGAPLSRPSEVRLSGPRSWVRSRDSVETETLVLTGKRDTLELVQPLLPPPPWASVSPGSVLVRVAIEPQDSGVRELTPVVTGLRPAFEARLDPPRVQVTWAAPRSAASTAERGLRAGVDVEHRGRGRFRLAVRITGDGAGYVRAVSPESVTVAVQ